MTYEDDEISARVERIATETGIEARCRLGHFDGFEHDGEWFPAYEAYVVRRKGFELKIDAEGLRRALQREGGDEFVRMNLQMLLNPWSSVTLP